MRHIGAHGAISVEKEKYIGEQPCLNPVSVSFGNSPVSRKRLRGTRSGRGTGAKGSNNRCTNQNPQQSDHDKLFYVNIPEAQMGELSETGVVTELHQVNGETYLKLIGKSSQLRYSFRI